MSRAQRFLEQIASRQKQLLTKGYNSDKVSIDNHIIEQANKFVNATEDKIVEYFNDGIFLPFLDSDKCSEYANDVSDNGNQDDATDLVIQIWVDILTKVDANKYAKIIRAVQAGI